MKVVSIVLLVVLALIAVGEGIFLLINAKDHQQLEDQIHTDQQKVNEFTQAKQGLENEKTSLTKKYSDLQFDYGKLSQQKDDLSKDKVSMTAQMTQKDEEIKKLQNLADVFKEDRDKKDAETRELLSEKNHLQDILMCKNPIRGIDFTNNESVNASLTKYVDDTKNEKEPVSAHYWNLIWTNSKYSIHTIEVHSEKDNMNYIWKFTVYFRGESYGRHENGVFYNDNQCWLYLDKQ